ncbi:MAG: HD-GYP domain-containing protein [Deltaproteobacteria bacterium]|nr:HD-GYP domain-containing protein [Deltaproteobacteria bacterium]
MNKSNQQAPLYNSRGINVYVKLLNQRYPHVNIREILNYAGMAPYEVADQAHWFTQKQINRFYEKCVQLSGNENIAREAGRYAATPELVGALEQVVFGQISPSRAYELIGKTAYSYARSSRYKTKKISSSSVEITAIQEEGVLEKLYQCQNRIGLFEAIAMGYTSQLPQIDHPECVFKGGKCCRYIITWEKTAFYVWKRLRNISIPLSFFLLLICFFLKPHLALAILLPVLLIIVLGLSRIVDFLEKKELRSSLNILRGSTDKLLEQVDINYNNTLITNEIGQSISRHTTIDDVLDKVIQISQKRLNYDRYLILLADKDKTKLAFRTGFGYSQEYISILTNTTFNLNHPDSKGAFVVSFREQKPFLINDINEIEENLSPRSLLFAKKLGTRSFICCPIICDGDSIGVLAVDNIKSKKILIQSDMSLLMGIASVIGISIRNAELMEGRERQYRSILQVLAASIDARDPLTAGHSEKVTEYSLGICDELGLARDYREMIRVAALLHDYGKLGVPDSILKKPGTLTTEEYHIVQTHAQKTREILEEINFEGILSQVPQIAGSHHEKLDGSGYPDGLAGDEIPLGARIIAVADFFEAITAERHYRGPMPVEEALELLNKESEKHFDPKIVAAFIQFFKKIYGRNEFG